MSPVLSEVLSKLAQVAIQAGEEVAIPALEQLVADLESKAKLREADAIDGMVDKLEDAKFGAKP